jgi:hypothetical protein
MHPGTRETTKRLATAIAAVLVLFATAMPAAAVCCFGKPAVRTMSMHASMPCCAGRCTLSNPSGSRDHDATLSPAPPTPSAAVAVASLVASAPATIGAGAVPANDHMTDGFSAPPPFLVNSQFRI